MSKVLVNSTGGDVAITDCGVTVAASSSYTIPPQDYSTFAASSDVITLLTAGTLTLTDGTTTIQPLSVAIDVIKGIIVIPVAFEGDAPTLEVPVFPALDGSGNLSALRVGSEGDDPFIGISAFAFKDSNSKLVLPTLNPDGTIPVSLASLTSDFNLVKVGGVAVALGQTTMAGSIPVTLPSDQVPGVFLPDSSVRSLLPATSAYTLTFTTSPQDFTFDTYGASQLTLMGSGSWSALIAVYGTNDGGTTVQNLPLFSWFDFSKQIFVDTANSGESCNIAGWRQIIVRAVTFSSGPANINVWFNQAVGPQMVMSGLAATFKTEAWARDGVGNALASATTAPGGTEQALIVRNIPSGTQTISGTVTANQGGSWTVAATQSGAWSTGRTWTLSSGTDSVTATISGTVGVTQSTSPWVVSGTVAATQSGTWDIGTLSTITNVVHVDDNSGSLTVDGTVAATQSGTWNITNISGTVSLPTGAATSALQTTANTSLASIDSKLTSPLAIANTSRSTSGTILNTNDEVVLDYAGEVFECVVIKFTNITTAEGINLSVIASYDGSTYDSDNAMLGLYLTSPDGNIYTEASADNGVYIFYAPTAKKVKVVNLGSNLSSTVTVLMMTTQADLASIGNLGYYFVKQGSGDTWNVALAASATSVAKAEDSASANADVGIPAMAIQKASPADTAGTDGDYAMLQMSAGRLWASVKVDTALPAGSNVIGGVTQSGTWNIGTVTTVTGITNVVHVDDNSGSLTVDNAGTFAVQATVAAGATNIAKAEDAASADADVGVPAMAVRKATPANTSGTDGDYEMLQISAGRLWTSAVIDTALPAGTAVIGALVANQTVDLNKIAGTATATGNGVVGAGVQRIAIASDNTAFSVNAAQSGTWNIGTLTSITNSVAVTVAASATNIAKAEDAASADADVGVPAMAVRKATPANTSGTDGDYEMLQISAGRLWASVVVDTALPAGTNAIGKLAANSGVIIGDVNVVNSNVSTNIAQMNGVAVTMGNGASGTGVQRVTIASDSTGQVTLATGANTIGALTANQSVNNAQTNGATTVTSVTGVQDVMPRKRTGSTGLSPNYSASRITSKTTTTVTASTAYVSAIAIACSAAGTSWTLVIQNKEGTPKILVPSFTLTVPTTGLPVILQFAEPILMTSGIDIVTGGTTAGTVDVFVTYWQ